jgi:hypothetical protein
MSGCRIIKAHNHDAIAERVQNAIEKAADDVTELYADTVINRIDKGEFRRRAHEIIMARAYYGDVLANGELTEEQLKAIHEFSNHQEPISEEVYNQFLAV